MTNSMSLPHLQRWLRYFPREQILILQHRDLKQDTPREVNRVCEFLGLPAFEFVWDTSINRGEYAPMSAGIRRRLEGFFAPHQAALAEFLSSWSQ